MGAFNTLYVINYPNRAGLACEPELVEYDFNGGSAQAGLPNFIQSYFNDLEPIEGEQEECEPLIELYPNPTTGTIGFSSDDNCGDTKTFSLRIVNSIGQKVVALKEGISIDQEVDISDLANGLYLFILTLPGQGQVVRKVVKIN